MSTGNQKKARCQSNGI